MKATASYKMSNQTKTGLALHKFRNEQERGEWKRAMIQAELFAAVQPKREKRDRKDPTE